MLRSGPFSDELVVGLLNSRFVPFYFDLGPGSPAGDPAAKEFVVAVKESLGGKYVSTPPVLLMTAGGELLAEVSNYASEQAMLDALRAVLKEHPEYAKTGEAEAELPRLEQARIAHWLGNDEAAVALLDGVREPAESLFLAQMARRVGHMKQARAALKELDSEVHAADISLEYARLAWAEGEYERMVADLRAYPSDGQRAAEAQYFLGMGQFHLGDPKQARATWKGLVEQFGEARWSYRADWAYCQTTDEGLGKKKTSFSTAGGGSLLGRHGYMGRQNPDLSSDRRTAKGKGR